MEGALETGAVDGPDESETGSARVERERLRQRMRQLVAALRSGQYQQTRGALHRAETVSTAAAGMCCLGVACEVAIANRLDVVRTKRTGLYWYGGSDGSGSSSTLPAVVVNWYGFDDDNPYLKVPDEVANQIDNERFREEYSKDHPLHAAAELNDEYWFTFAQIADCFEATFLPDDWEVTRASR